MKIHRRIIFLEVCLYVLTALHSCVALLVFSKLLSIPREISLYLEFYKRSDETQKELMQKVPHAFNFSESASLNGIVLSIGLKLLVLACAWLILAKICRLIQSKTLDWAGIARKLNTAAILFAVSFSLDVLQVLTTNLYNQFAGPDRAIPLESLFNTMGVLSLIIPRLDGAVTLVLCMGAYAAKGLTLRHAHAQQELQLTI